MNIHRGSNLRRTSVRRGLSAWSLVVVAVVGVGVSLTIPQLLLRGIGVSPVVATSVCMIALALAIGHYAPALRIYPAQHSGSAQRPSAVLVAAAVLGGFCLWSTGAIIARLLITDEENSAQRLGVEPYLLTLLFVLAIAPVTEEILYRGLLQGALNRVSPVALSVALTTAVFALVHPRPRDMIMAGAVGLLAGVTREVFGTMTAPIMAHIAMNTASVLVPAAAVSRLAHGPAAVPVLALLAVSILLIGIIARSAGLHQHLNLESPMTPSGKKRHDP